MYEPTNKERSIGPGARGVPVGIPYPSVNLKVNKRIHNNIEISIRLLEVKFNPSSEGVNRIGLKQEFDIDFSFDPAFVTNIQLLDEQTEGVLGTGWSIGFEVYILESEFKADEFSMNPAVVEFKLTNKILDLNKLLPQSSKPVDLLVEELQRKGIVNSKIEISLKISWSVEDVARLVTKSKLLMIKLAQAKVINENAKLLRKGNFIDKKLSEGKKRSKSQSGRRKGKTAKNNSSRRFKNTAEKLKAQKGRIDILIRNNKRTIVALENKAKSAVKSIRGQTAKMIAKKMSGKILAKVLLKFIPLVGALSLIVDSFELINFLFKLFDEKSKSFGHFGDGKDLDDDKDAEFNNFMKQASFEENPSDYPQNDSQTGQVVADRDLPNDLGTSLEDNLKEKYVSDFKFMPNVIKTDKYNILLKSKHVQEIVSFLGDKTREEADFVFRISVEKDAEIFVRDINNSIKLSKIKKSGEVNYTLLKLYIKDNQNPSRWKGAYGKELQGIDIKNSYTIEIYVWVNSKL